MWNSTHSHVQLWMSSERSCRMHACECVYSLFMQTDEPCTFRMKKNSCEFLSHSSCVWRNEGMHVERPQTAEPNRRWTQCDVSRTRSLRDCSCIARRQLLLGFWHFCNQLQWSISHNAGLTRTCTNMINFGFSFDSVIMVRCETAPSNQRIRCFKGVNTRTIPTHFHDSCLFSL